jgi:hypothetical protein
MPTKRNSELEKQLTRLRHQKNLLWLGILFFVLVILWILVSIFTSSRTSTISPELRELAKPFIPRLESRIFDDIGAQRTYGQGELGFFSIYIVDKNSLEENPQLIDITMQISERSQLANQAEKIETEPATTEDATFSAELAPEASIVEPIDI